MPACSSKDPAAASPPERLAFIKDDVGEKVGVDHVQIKHLDPVVVDRRVAAGCPSSVHPQARSASKDDGMLHTRTR